MAASHPALHPLSLVGRHVRLEPLGHEHAAPLLAAASEARSTYAFTLVPEDLAGMQRYVATALGEQERGESIPFVVLDPAGTPVGSTRFMKIERWVWPGEVPPRPAGAPEAVEIGFTWYAERVQRTAINTEAKLLLCTHAFEAWEVFRVTWRTHARNERSRAAILRLGARFEGVARAAGPAWDGGVRDAASFSMLREEWPHAKRALEQRLAR
jgi:RimJ/RimL family protein N-acetyltransferase